MILYNVYDTEKNEYICRGLNYKEVSALLEYPAELVPQSARRNGLIRKRYRVEAQENEYVTLRARGFAEQRLADEWDEVTRKAREWFAYMRGKK